MSSALRIQNPPAAAVDAARTRADLAEQRLRYKTAQLAARGLAVRANLMGDYTAARRNRTSGGSTPQSTSADAQLDQFTLTRLRGVAQRFMRNSPLCRAMVRRRVDRVIGSGPTFQSKSTDAAFKAAAEKWFERWASGHADVRGLRSFWALVRDLYKATIVDGDAGAIHVAGVSPERAIDPVTGAMTPAVVGSLQAIEAERIRSPFSAVGASSGTGEAEIIQGVECDRLGRPQAFHVAQWERQGNSTQYSTARVDAADFVFLVPPERLNQTRGEPRLAAIAVLQEHLGEFVSATVMAARAGACQAGVVQTKNPSATQAALMGSTETRTDGLGREKRHIFEPLTPTFLGPDEEYKGFNPTQPGPIFDPFVRLIITIMGTDLDLPPELTLLDHSKSTAYAGRSALSSIKPTIEAEREMMREQALDRIGAWVIGMGIASGALPFVPDWAEWDWVWPADPSFEPDRELDALIKAVNANFTTQEAVIATLGGDITKVFAQRAREIEMERELGIGRAAPPPTPAAPPPSAAPPPAKPAPAKPEAPANPEATS